MNESTVKNLKSMEGILPNFYNKIQINNNTEIINLKWPDVIAKALEAMSKGPDFSNVDSGDLLSIAISDLRNSLSLKPLSPSASRGYSLFFDDHMRPEESSRWFKETLPSMARLVLRFPLLLDSHYECGDDSRDCGKLAPETCLRLLPSQQPGVVLLSQVFDFCGDQRYRVQLEELIAAILACSFFCLFPDVDRRWKELPTINFDILFGSLYESYSEKQESKIKCIIHYFERVSSCMPKGFVSFERKVLPFESQDSLVSYPEADFWRKSGKPLCPFKVLDSGFIEDQPNEALEADFANKYLGGGALHRGCVQEEIRFMINPELIAGMLFLPCMEDNEAIEIVGAERFSNYTGYATSFRFSGDHMDQRNIDSLGRRKTRIIAMDALCNPGERQYRLKYLLREINKAFCGFSDSSKYGYYKTQNQEDRCQGAGSGYDRQDANAMSKNGFLLDKGTSTSVEMNKMLDSQEVSDEKGTWYEDHEDKIGIATGNWGCGAFGGDPEVKSMIQWVAASQALRPFLSYYSFGINELQRLNQVTGWILSHKWTVGDLWNILVEYSFQRLNDKTKDGFFTWLLPSLGEHESNAQCCRCF